MGYNSQLTTALHKTHCTLYVVIQMARRETRRTANGLIRVRHLHYYGQCLLNGSMALFIAILRTDYSLIHYEIEGGRKNVWCLGWNQPLIEVHYS